MKLITRHFLIAAVLTLGLCSGFLLLHSSANLQLNLAKLSAPSESEGPREVREMELAMLADPATGQIPAGIGFKESLFARNLIALAKGQQTNSTDPWHERGPWNVGGRTRAFAIDATNENILFAGGVSGGLWRSTDAGNSWTRVTDRMSKPDVVAIAQDLRPGHTNTWYYLSGEAYGTSASGGGSFYLGDGMFKSTDGGLTWNPIASTSTGTQNVFSTNWQVTWNLATDPSNLSQDELYAATYDGIYRSIDGGSTWTNPLHGGAASSYFTDVAVTDSGVVYATLSSDGAGRGVYRSTDGINWTNILPANFPYQYDLIKIGINPSNQNEVYFLCGGTDTMGLLTVNAWGDKEWNSLYRYNYVSGNGSGAGGTWTDLTMNLPHNIGIFDDFHAQGSYNLVVRVKPDDPNTVFVGATNIYRSTDGFTTPNNVTQVGGYGIHTQLVGFTLYPNHHPDQHEILFSPSNPNIMYSACDGGVYRTDSCMATSVSWNKLNRGYLTTQFYTACALHDYTSDILFGGLQDNGIFLTDNTNLQSNWSMPFNGDGSYLATSADDQTYYLSIQQGKIIKAKLNAAHAISQFARIDPIYASRDDYEFINPFVLDPNDDNVMYLPAGHKLFRNDNLSAIPFAGNIDSIATNWVQFPDTIQNNGTTAVRISAVACSNANPMHRVYYGTSAKKIYRIDNANTGTPTRVDITGNTMPNGYVNCIAVDPDNGDHVVVVFSNYNIYSIFYSTNAGATWTRVAGNLEKNLSGTGDAPSIRWIAMMHYQGHLKYFAGTSVGLYSADSLTIHDNAHAGTQWTQEGVNEIGQTIVPYIYVRDVDQYLAVATHGSGMYTCHYGWNVGVDKIDAVASDIQLSPNPSSDFVKINANLKANASVTLTVFNLKGQALYQTQENSATGNWQTTIPVATYPTGTYIARITSNGKSWNKKFVITH